MILVSIRRPKIITETVEFVAQAADRITAVITQAMALLTLALTAIAAGIFVIAVKI